MCVRNSSTELKFTGRLFLLSFPDRPPLFQIGVSNRVSGWTAGGSSSRLEPGTWPRLQAAATRAPRQGAAERLACASWLTASTTTYPPRPSRDSPPFSFEVLTPPARFRMPLQDARRPESALGPRCRLAWPSSGPRKRPLKQAKCVYEYPLAGSWWECLAVIGRAPSLVELTGLPLALLP